MPGGTGRTRSAPDYVDTAERAWACDEPYWGIWGIPETEVRALDGIELARADVVELGCGTAYWSAWFARRGASPVGVDLTDFADTAAVVAQLDLLICVDTALAHLAGALGKPCWVMLPATDNEWRWTRARTGPASPWYADNVRAFRQTQPGNWAQVVDAMRSALEAR